MLFTPRSSQILGWWLTYGSKIAEQVNTTVIHMPGSKSRYLQYSFTPETSIKPEVTTREKGGGRKCKQLTFDFELLYFTDSGVGKEDRAFAQQKNTQITLAVSEEESSD